jgi:serine/threonine protein phosphatase 1
VPGRTFAIGDIHGCDVALDTLLSKLALTAQDKVVLLGDVVDRGPDSRRVIERLIDLQAKCQVVLILGNHEEMMLDALRGGEWLQSWLAYGGATTLASYGDDPANIPREHLDFLSSGREFAETEFDIFIHATLDPRLELPAQPPELLRWTHLTGNESPHVSGKRVICGHTPQLSGVPLAFPGWICIDTAVFKQGWLTALDVDTGEIHQASQAGKFRKGTPMAG